MIDLDATWQDMETKAPPSVTGSYRRRIYPESAFDLYVTLEKPSNYRAMLFEVSADAVSSLGDLPSTRAVTSRIAHITAQNTAVLELTLVDPRFATVFSTLVGDLSDVILSCVTQQQAQQHFLTRLHQWIIFLEQFGPEGLSSEAQRGLYGELWFLKNYLLNKIAHLKAIRAWTGPYATSQDFQLPDAAVEVKVTTATLPQNLLISNEKQLDNSAVETLLLLHLSLDARQSSGETLNKIIDAIRNLLSASGSALYDFEQRLFRVGYLDKHRTRYDTEGYTVLDHKFFHVIGEFPALTPASLPVGVGNVHYSIEVSACLPFTVATQFVLSTITKGS